MRPVERPAVSLQSPDPATGGGFAGALVWDPEVALDLVTGPGAELVEDPLSGSRCAFDGRLDEPTGRASAAAVLAAYERHGPRALERLIGDFALALWDAPAGRLLLAVDHMRMRELCWVRRPGGLLFASRLEALLAHPDVPVEPDHDGLAAYMYDTQLTGPFYRDVERLLGGEAIRFDARRGDERRWSLAGWPEEPPDRPLSGAAAIEAFRETLFEAVRCRLPTGDPAGVLLSGGLDSGSVACVAGHLTRAGERPHARAYSMVFDRVRSADERSYSRAVTARHGLPHTLVPIDDHGPLSHIDRLMPVLVEPYLGPYDSACCATLERARDDGVTVVLSGNGGDLLLDGSRRYTITAQARERQLTQLAAELRALPPRLPGALARRLRARWTDSARARSRSLAPPGAVPQTTAPTHHLGSWRGLRNSIVGNGRSHQNVCLGRLNGASGVELRQPLLDVRLARLVLELAPEMLYGRGVHRRVLRAAIGDLLPAELRARTDKTSLGPAMSYALRGAERPLMERLAHESEAARRGLVVGERLAGAVRSYLEGDEGWRTPLWWILSGELWLRRLAARPV